MKHFTPEYIKECDCKEIQGLHKVFQYGDAIMWERFESSKTKRQTHDLDYLGQLTTDFERDKTRHDIWLPTGDQLDDEIVGICKEQQHDYYIEMFHGHYDWTVKFCCSHGGECSKDKDGILFAENDRNPLIAKIKLLKELLNAN